MEERVGWPAVGDFSTVSSFPWLLFFFSAVAVGPKENSSGSGVVVWGTKQGMPNMGGGVSFLGAALVVAPKENSENGFVVDNVSGRTSSLGASVTSRF